MNRPEPTRSLLRSSGLLKTSSHGPLVPCHVTQEQGQAGLGLAAVPPGDWPMSLTSAGSALTRICGRALSPTRQAFRNHSCEPYRLFCLTFSLLGGLHSRQQQGSCRSSQPRRLMARQGVEGTQARVPICLSSPQSSSLSPSRGLGHLDEVPWRILLLLWSESLQR